MAVPRVTLSQTNFEMGTTVTITAHRPLGSGERIKMHWLFGAASGYIVGNASDWSQVDIDSATWTPTVAMLAAQIPNAVSGIGTVYCDYFASGGEYIGTTGAGFTAIVPASVVPVIGSIEIFESDSTAEVGTIVGQIVQHLSAPTLRLDATSVYGSPIVTRKFQVNDYFYWDDSRVEDSRFSVDLPVLSSSDWLTVTAIVTDARGRTATTTRTVEVLPYWGPRITDFLVQRCDADGVLNDTGTSAKVTSSGNVPTLFNGDEKNQLTWTVYSRIVGDEIWGDPVKQTIPAGLTWASTDILGLGAYSATEAYEFRLDCADRFNTAISIVAITTGVVTMSWVRGGVGVSKVWEQGALDVGGQIYQNGLEVVDSSGLDVDVSSLITKPTGSLVTDWHASRAGKVLTLQIQFQFATGGGTALGAGGTINSLSVPAGLRPVIDAEVALPRTVAGVACWTATGTVVLLTSVATTLSGSKSATMVWIIA